MYTPQKANEWSEEKYGMMLNDTHKCLGKIIEETEYIIIMRGFSCKEILWMTRGGEESWSQRNLNLAVNSIMTQWIKEDAELRGK